VKKFAIGVCAALLCLTGASAQAQQEGDSGALLVIMDISGSMAEDDGSGAPRIEGAQTAVEDLVDAVPDGTRIGLRVYGDQYEGDDQAEGCQDIRLAVPIGPVSSTGPQIVSEIDGVTPTGFTPIGASLQAAADDFTDEANRSIVLVSDGEDTCGEPPPCEVAEQLTSDGIEVRVDTIGLTIEDNPTAQGELECIAEVTGGTYVEAADATELTERLSQVSTRAIQGWSAEGEEIDGGPIVTGATPIEPGTTYIDDVVSGEARWYSFPVQEGQDVTVTMSEDGSLFYGCCVVLRLYQPDQQTDYGREGGFSDETPKIYRTGTREEGAEQTGDHYVSVVLDDDDSEGAPLEYQLDVAVEGSGADDTATATESATSAPSDDAGQATATASPDDAGQATATATPDDAGDDTAASTPEEETAATDAATNSDDGNGLLTALVIILAVAVVALGGAVVWLMARMRKGSG
jgi:Ca-activated chloride channel family protein